MNQTHLIVTVLLALSKVTLQFGSSFLTLAPNSVPPFVPVNFTSIKPFCAARCNLAMLGLSPSLYLIISTSCSFLSRCTRSLGGWASAKVFQKCLWTCLLMVKKYNVLWKWSSPSSGNWGTTIGFGGSPVSNWAMNFCNESGRISVHTFSMWSSASCFVPDDRKNWEWVRFHVSYWS